jgi:hypothetical protein
MTEEIVVRSDARTRLPQVVEQFNIAAPNLIRPGAQQLMSRADALVPPEQDIVTMMQAQERAPQKAKRVVVLTSQQLLVFDESTARGVHRVALDECRCTSFSEDTWWGSRMELRGPRITYSFRQMLPYEEALRIAWACGWQNPSDHSLLGDRPKDPGCPPLAYGPATTLYPDRLVHELRHLPFDGPVQATVDTAGNIAVTRGRDLGAKAAGTLLLGPIGLFMAGNAKHREVDTRELYLLIEGAAWAVTVQCAAEGAGWVRDFAAKVNLAARKYVAARTPTPPPSGGVDPASQLVKLAELHAAGALTDQEFSAAKARLLGL